MYCNSLHCMLFNCTLQEFLNDNALEVFSTYCYYYYRLAVLSRSLFCIHSSCYDLLLFYYPVLCECCFNILGPFAEGNTQSCRGLVKVIFLLLFFCHYNSKVQLQSQMTTRFLSFFPPCVAPLN